jgi:signal transduction histidine kinase
VSRRPLDRLVLWLALAATAGVAVTLPLLGGSGAQDAVVGLLALLVLAVVLGRLRAERGDRRRMVDQNRELRALLAERGREQERTETLYRVGQRLSGETEPQAIARIGLAGLCALAGASGGAFLLGDDGPPVTFGDCPQDLRDRADRADGIRIQPDAWGATVRVPVARADRLLGTAHLALPGVAGITELDGPAISHLAGQIAIALDNARAFQAARRQAGIVRAVLDATPDAIHLVDADGGILMSNAPFETSLVPLLGAVGGVDARTADDVAGVMDPQAYLADVATIRADRNLQAVHEFRLNGTGRSFVRYTAPVRDRLGHHIGRVFVHREVTAEREAERLKDEFLALVSHELRTPLTSVIGYLELLLDGEGGELTPDQERFLGITDRNARRLLRLVGDLLVVAQAEAGRMTLAPEPLDLAALAAERVEAAGPAADAARVGMGVDGDPTLMVDGDRERLGQVIDNLLANAVRFSPAGSDVRIRVERRGGEAVVSVSDSGPGIDPDELPHVFERFYRGRAAGATSGTGLGLAICQLIASAHGGRMEVASRPGAGATFRLRMPVPQAAAAGAAPAGLRAG